jgi:RHH-type transcriptional regulator, proline utilization regulon repressor / proline dehydrogenase / delta 1-pyrroline-5-carboxylate dehydrogenase
MSYLDYLQKAQEIIQAIKKKPLTAAEKQQVTIELASHILNAANSVQTRAEKKGQLELSKMMLDPKGKAFTTNLTDQCFRSKNPKRIADQIIFLIKELGIPRYLSFFNKLALFKFKIFGKFFASIAVPLVKWMLRKRTKTVIIPGEKTKLNKHLKKRHKENVRINLNHLGEAILGEKEAMQRLSIYLEDLTKETIDYISIKISTIFSQINLLGRDKTLNVLADRLRQLYRVAKSHYFIQPNGSKTPKFVNLDMEEYKDLHLTVDLFKKVLSEPEFLDYSAGIVLQAYLPDTHEIQKDLIAFATNRIKNKGAPIKIRIVKGANLAMERVEASIKGWPQTPYKTKTDTDANYKRMILYGCIPEHAKAVHIGVASHNLFDIAFALILRAENSIEKEVSFEMLEGMADHMRKVIQHLSQDILLYCPVATKKDFQSAIAYLIRRLDENTGSENFLRHSFGLKPNTPDWESQVVFFKESYAAITTASIGPRRLQNRMETTPESKMQTSFENEPDTDFALPANLLWLEQTINHWKNKNIPTIPSVSGGKEIVETSPKGIGCDPSAPTKTLYTYSMATWDEIDKGLKIGKEAEKQWSSLSPEKISQIFAKVAEILKTKRGELIYTMLTDAGKNPSESDSEISEAIDYAQYYRKAVLEINSHKDIKWSPLGTFLVTPPWNFPIAIPCGSILGALAMGNGVIFKPAKETVLCGWRLINILWEAGIPKNILQFINCTNDSTGTMLIKDPRINGVILTGSTATAKHFLQLRPGLHLTAETGGKNSIIITALSDRDLAIKDLLQSAFGHSGQKCSATSLAILEAEVYDDPHFQQQLKDAALSLHVGSAWDFSSKVVPLIREANETLLKGLTTLEKGEQWLIQPSQNSINPNLWSPGIKWGVQEGSFTHQTELFGPILGVMRAKNLSHAIDLANTTRYGLTSGLHSLDPREHLIWQNQIDAGNLYINRGTTGAIIQRQPFGGTKDSSFGAGWKTGGANYLIQFASPFQISLPHEKAPIPTVVENFSKILEKTPLSAEELSLWHITTAHYAFWATKLQKDQDKSLLLGEDNPLLYRPYKSEKICLRIQENDTILDVLRVCAAATICNTRIQISWTKNKTNLAIDDQWHETLPLCTIVEESEEAFYEKVKTSTFRKIRLLSPPTQKLQEAASKANCYIIKTPVLANGRFELIHYLQEISLSNNYHRYGNLGLQENEPRTAIF